VQYHASLLGLYCKKYSFSCLPVYLPFPYPVLMFSSGKTGKSWEMWCDTEVNGMRFQFGNMEDKYNFNYFRIFTFNVVSKLPTT
jgi:hypothetical protein